MTGVRFFEKDAAANSNTSPTMSQRPLGLKPKQSHAHALDSEIPDYHARRPAFAKELKNELEFSSWYQSVENGLLEASYEGYQ